MSTQGHHMHSPSHICTLTQTCMHTHAQNGKMGKNEPLPGKEPYSPLHITGTLRDERAAFGPCVYSQESWLLSSCIPFPRSRFELVLGFPRLEVRIDLCHSRDPLGDLPVGLGSWLASPGGGGLVQASGCLGPGPEPRAGGCFLKFTCSAAVARSKTT